MTREQLYVPLAVRGRGPDDHTPCALTLIGVVLVAALFIVPALIF